MAARLYLGEAAGNRVLRYGTSAPTRVTSAGTQVVNVDVETWDVVPLGPVGDALFRIVGGTVRYSNGYDVQITPYVDGVALAAQRFTGYGSGEAQIEAFIAKRGARLRCRIQSLARLGDLELDQFVVTYVPIRTAP